LMPMTAPEVVQIGATVVRFTVSGNAGGLGESFTAAPLLGNNHYQGTDWASPAT
jgi:hypothetical protein